jgi:hypothetical protein
VEYFDTPGLTYDSGHTYASAVVPPTDHTKMPKIKVKLNLDRLTDEQLIQKAKAIKLAMTGNANFPSPVPTVPNMNTLITTAETKLGAANLAQQAAKQATTEKNAALDAVRAAVTDWGGYVQISCGGDAAKVQSAGMDVKAVVTPPTLPPPVQNLSLTAGDNAGEIDAQWDSMNVRTFQMETSPDPMTSSSWTRQKDVTKSKSVILNLVSGTRVWVRVRAVNPAGEGPWSDPATRIVP